MGSYAGAVGAGAGARRDQARHQLEGSGRDGRLLPGRERRHLREERHEGHHLPGRATGEPAPVPDQRPARLHPRALDLLGTALSARGHPDGGGGWNLPALAAGAHGASGQHRGQKPEGHRRQAGDGGEQHARDLLVLPQDQLWLYRQPDPALHVQPGAVPRRQEGDPAGVRDFRAVLGAHQGGIRAQGFPALGFRL